MTSACAAILALVMGGCGGGGGGDTAPAMAVVSGTSTAASANQTAPAQPQGDGSTTAARTSPTTSTNADTVGTARALSASASLSLEGIAEAPPSAQPLAAVNTNGRSFFVNSLTGDDSNDGRWASSGSGAAGPWKSLARVMQSDLRAGDLLLLSCGSVWNETLRLPASGTVSQPIVVRAASTDCKSKPTIDGSVTLAAVAWTRHEGNIFKASLERSPFQLFAAAGNFNEAHHPNRGYVASSPGSLYAAMVANGNVVSVNGQSGSTSLMMGSDLALPAGIQLRPGMRVRVRTNSWILDESVVSAVDGNRLTLTKQTSFPLLAGWGYFLLGELWMLDSAGEWYYNTATKEVYAWMPDSQPPTLTVAASVLALGVDLNGRANVVLDGIAVKRVGAGVQLRRSIGVTVRNSTIEDTAEMGADAADSTNVVLESNAFKRIGTGAISARDDDSHPASGMVIRNNIIRNSGVIMEGDVAVSLPKMTHAAIRSGELSQVVGNTIIDAGYNGIRLMGGSLAEDNFIFGTCTVLDDCGGIYASTYKGSTIRRNVVVRSRGNSMGKPAAVRYTQAQGIYLDDATTDNLVENNTVVDADNGVHIHVSGNNTVRANRLYGNRNSQLWMQDREDYNGAVKGNVIDSNQIAAVYPGSVGILLQTNLGSTAAFGTFTANRFYDRSSAAAVVEITATELRALTFAQWQQSQGIGSRTPVDATGTSVSGRGYAAYSVTGTNLVTNGALTQNAAGWTSWNETAPLGQLLRETCSTGWCLRYVAGASVGLIASPYFSLTQGQWYRLSLDLSTPVDGQPVQVVVRRGGGGSNGYESLSDRNLALTAGRAWGRYSLVFQAIQTITAGNPTTGDNGARLDIQGITNGQSVSVANVELVPIVPDALAQLSGSVANVSSVTSAINCPYAISQPAVCSKFINLADDRPLVWPIDLQSRSGIILYAQEPSLVDTDNDGIPDGQDRCQGTAPGAPVNASGCSFIQR